MTRGWIGTVNHDYVYQTKINHGGSQKVGWVLTKQIMCFTDRNVRPWNVLKRQSWSVHVGLDSIIDRIVVDRIDSTDNIQNRKKDTARKAV